MKKTNTKVEQEIVKRLLEKSTLTWKEVEAKLTALGRRRQGVCLDEVNQFLTLYSTIEGIFAWNVWDGDITQFYATEWTNMFREAECLIAKAKKAILEGDEVALIWGLDGASSIPINSDVLPEKEIQIPAFESKFLLTTALVSPFVQNISLLEEEIEYLLALAECREAIIKQIAKYQSIKEKISFDAELLAEKAKQLARDNQTLKTVLDNMRDWDEFLVHEKEFVANQMLLVMEIVRSIRWVTRFDEAEKG